MAKASEVSLQVEQLTAEAPQSASSSTCNKYASPTGSDSNGGGAGDPYLTAAKLVQGLAALPATQQRVGCFRKSPGDSSVYSFSSLEIDSALSGTAAGQPTILQTDPDDAAAGRFARLRGHLHVSGDLIQVSKLYLDNSGAGVSPEVSGSDVTFADDNISNSNATLTQAANCFRFFDDLTDPAGPPQNGVVLRSRVHHCKKGVRVAQGLSTHVGLSLIYDNRDAGVDFGPAAHASEVVRSIIDQNFDNARFAGPAAGGVVTDGSATDNTLIAASILSFPQTSPRQSANVAVNPDLNGFGTHNNVLNNCLWSPNDPGGAYSNDYAHDGLEERAQNSSGGPGQRFFFLGQYSPVADPQYADREHANFTISPTSPCFEKTAHYRTGTDIYTEVLQGGGPPDEPAPERPNVLIILTDDQRADTAVESAMPKTMQWFKTEGTQFTNSFATTPLCCPARTSIFTGLYTHNHGVWHNEDAENACDHHARTLQRYLEDAGYGSGLFDSKYLNLWVPDKLACSDYPSANPAAVPGPPPHFNEYAITAGYRPTSTFTNISDQGQVASTDPPATLKGLSSPYGLDHLRQQIVGAGNVPGFLERRENEERKPWFLYLAANAPHSAGPRYGPDAWQPMTDGTLYDFPAYPVAPYQPPNETAAGQDRADKPQWVQQWGASRSWLLCTDNTDNEMPATIRDGKVNDGCPAVGPAEAGTACNNATDDDGDGKVNDGCPRNAIAETDYYITDDFQLFERPGFPGLQEQQYRTLRSLDDLVDAVFQELEAKGEADNTLAFFISDNGYMWREHGAGRVDCDPQTDADPCGPSEKGQPYLPSIEVPLFSRWPAQHPGGDTDTRLAANIDLAPTVMNAVGLSPSAFGQGPMDGRSLFDSSQRCRLLTEGVLGRIENAYADPKELVPQWSSTITPPSPVSGCLPESYYQYVEYGTDTDPRNGDDSNFREYYDLASDPGELTNLLNDGNPGNDPPTGSIASRLAADRACAGPSCP